MEYKTIEDVKNNGLFKDNDYDYIMQQSMEVLQNHSEIFKERNMDIGDTPISPMSMEDDLTPILLSKSVMDSYRKLVEMINTPSTAKEYSYVLLGKKASVGDMECYFVDQIIDCNLQSENLSDRETHINNDKLNATINYAIKNDYNFISLGHTHPNIPESEKQVTLANFLPKNVKEHEYIRDAGLNLSLQDFVNYDSLYQYFINNPNIRTCQTIIMYNGEMAMINRSGNKYKRHTVILDSIMGEPVYVSSKEEIKQNNHSL